MDDGDWRAPIALAADQPVAEAIGHPRPAPPRGGQIGGDARPRLGRRQAAVRAGVDGNTFILECGRRTDDCRLLHYRDDGQVVAPGEGVVARVVGGHAHNRARSVATQHVIGHPHWHGRAGQRVRGVGAGEDARLLLLVRLALDLAQPLGCFDIGADLGRPFRRGVAPGQRVLRGQGQEGDAVQRVGPGGEDADLFLFVRRCHFSGVFL